LGSAGCDAGWKTDLEHRQQADELASIFSEIASEIATNMDDHDGYYDCTLKGKIMKDLEPILPIFKVRVFFR